MEPIKSDRFWNKEDIDQAVQDAEDAICNALDALARVEKMANDPVGKNGFDRYTVHGRYAKHDGQEIAEWCNELRASLRYLITNVDHKTSLELLRASIGMNEAELTQNPCGHRDCKDPA